MKKYKSKDCLFIYFQNNNIMVNKREKNLLYNFYFRQTAFSLILSLFFYLYLLFFPYLFRFNFFVSEWNVHILFCRHIWAELSLLLDISERNFLPRWGGARALPLRTCLHASVYFFTRPNVRCTHLGPSFLSNSLFLLFLNTL